MGGEESKPAQRPPPPPSLFDQPWRTVPHGKEKYLQIVKDYKPHNEELQHLRILLHGPPGSGKSSFINSVDTILQGRMAGQALTDANSQDSFTVQHKTYKIQKGEPETFYPVVFTDTMGLEKNYNGGICVEDIKLAMKGHIKDGYKYNPTSQISEDDRYYNKNPTLKDRVHVLVCVISAGTSGILSSESVKKMRAVRLAARDLGIPQLAIVTKIDEACPEVKKDLRNVYKSTYVKDQMSKLHTALGIPLNCIFPVKNYHEEIDTDDGVDVLILSALKQMINFGEDFINNL